MNQQKLQSLRYKLQRNYQRLAKAHYSNFHFILIQFWNFLKTEPFNSILQRLASEYPQMEDDATETIRNANSRKDLFRRFGNTFEEQSALAYFVIKKCAENELNDDEQESNIGFIYSNSTTDRAASTKIFVLRFVEPLSEFIDESLNTNIAISHSLIRYKKRSEWFKRESLLKLYHNNTQKGEKNLSKDLYEYLFEQGIDFSIEPESISGRADLVLAQNSPTPLVADAKVFNGNKSYLLKGFRQVYQYTIDYNQSYGYLIIFKICEDDLKIEVNQDNQLLPFVVHNNKTIFFLTIDIHNYDKSASQRGNLKSYVIKELDLIKAMEETKDV